MSGIDFSDVVPVLEDPMTLTISDAKSEEDRYISMGMDGMGRLLVMVYTLRGNRIRLISARKADKLERQQYEDLP